MPKLSAVERVAVGLLLGSVCLFVLYPVLAMVGQSFLGQAGYDLSMYGEVWQSYLQDLRHSIFVASWTAALTTLFALGTALLLVTRRGRMRILLLGIVLIAMVSPPFVSAISYIQLYGRRGWISYQLLGLRFDPYNAWGIIAMQSLSFIPLNALLLRGLLGKLDSAAISAARDLGASPRQILQDIVLPLIRPGIWVSLLLAFIRSLADFGTPSIIGGRYNTLASDIYMQLVGYADLQKAAVMNVCLLLPSLLAFFFYRRLMREADRISRGAGQQQKELELPLHRCGLPGFLAIAVSAVFLLLNGLQYISIFLSGFLRSKRGTYSFTFDFLKELMHYNGSIFYRSIVYALIVSFFGSILAILFAYYMERRQLPGRSLFDWVVTLPYMLPGTCFGIAYILAFNHPPLKLTGTALIVLLNMLYKQLPTTSKLCAAAMAQVPEALEKSARDLGANRFYVLRDVIFPAMKPAFLSSFAYNFSSSMTTAGAIIFLIDPGRQLAVFKLFDSAYIGEYEIASLIAMLIILIVLLVEGLLFLLMGKKRRDLGSFF